MHYLRWDEKEFSAISMQIPPALQIGLLNLGLRFWFPHLASLLFAIKATTAMAKWRNFILNVFKWILAKQNQNYYLSFQFGVKVGNDSIWWNPEPFYIFWNPPFYGVVLLLEISYWIKFYFSMAIRTWLVKKMLKPRGLQ